MAHQRFFVFYTSFRHINQIIHDAILQPQQQIQVAEARIGIDQRDPLAAHGQSHSQICRRSGLAHAALARCDNVDFTHCFSPAFPTVRLALLLSVHP